MRPSLAIPPVILLASSLALAAQPKPPFTECETLPGHHEEVEVYRGGAPAVSRCFEGEMLDGPMRGWRPNGAEYKSGSYRKGEMHGEWTRYYPNGKVKDRGRFNRGAPDGPWTIWHSNGNVKAEGVFDDGRLKSDWTRYPFDAKAPAAAAPAPASVSVPVPVPAPTPAHTPRATVSTPPPALEEYPAITTESGEPSTGVTAAPTFAVPPPEDVAPVKQKR